MIGFYPRANTTAPVVPESAAEVASFLASYSATVATTLPNFLLATPSPTVPPYTFNTSVPATRGELVQSGLATSTYKPLLASKHTNATALPAITPSPTVATFILTDTSGHTLTSVSTAPQISVTLGVPEGWSVSGAPRARTEWTAVAAGACAAALAWGIL